MVGSYRERQVRSAIAEHLAHVDPVADLDQLTVFQLGQDLLG